MKRTVFIALVCIMMVSLFTQCATMNSSKPYREAKNLLDELETSIDKAKDCDEMFEALDNFTERFEEIDNSGLTENEKRLVVEEINKLTDVTDFKMALFECEEYFKIHRRLPPPIVEDSAKEEIKPRNKMTVVINKNDEIFVNEQPCNLSQLKDIAKHFMTPRPYDETAPEVETKTIPGIEGEVPMSKGVISLQNERGTSYAMYISVQNELAQAFNELKDELAMKKFHKHLDQLNEDESKAINEAVPIRISEAEPVSY